MRSRPEPPQTCGDEPPVEQVTEADLAGLFADLKAAERLLGSAVRRAGRLAGSGVAERVEGGPLDWAISMACRFTGADARTLVGAGETLRTLPTVDRLFADEVLSWGQVRRITDAARRLTVAQRSVLDQRVAAAVDEYNGVHAFDPDHLCDAVDAAAEQLRDARSVERQERAAQRANFMAVQGRIDGGATAYLSGDAVGFAPILNALDAACPTPTATPDAERGEGQPTRQGKQLFDAMRDICGEYLTGNNSDLIPADDPASGSGGDDGPGGDSGGPRQPLDPAALAGPVPGGRRQRRRRPARPLYTLQLDLSQFTIAPSGAIELNVPGALPRISAAAMEILARDADFRAVLFDGRRPLAVSAKIKAEDIPADTRIAVRARDGGDRWPGSRAPIGWSEPHHITWRSHGGTHDPDNLASLSRPWHTRVHRDGWQITLHPHTGELRAKRGKRTWRSLPKTTGLPPPPPTKADELTGQHPGEPPPGTLPF